MIPSSISGCKYSPNLGPLFAYPVLDINEGFFCGVLEDCEANPAVETITHVSNLLMCINSAANFLMYMVSQINYSGAETILHRIGIMNHNSPIHEPIL